jgi:hypothetical protein
MPRRSIGSTPTMRNMGGLLDPPTGPNRVLKIAVSTSCMRYRYSRIFRKTCNFEWREELQRVTCPGAILLLTVHGENFLQPFPKEARDEAERSGGFLYNTDAELTAGLPEFYRNSYHTAKYVRQNWSKYFEILDHRVLGLEKHQDIVVCRRR